MGSPSPAGLSPGGSGEAHAVEGHHHGPAEAQVVLQRDLCPGDLPPPGQTAQLPAEFGALRQAWKIEHRTGGPRCRPGAAPAWGEGDRDPPHVPPLTASPAPCPPGTWEEITEGNLKNKRASFALPASCKDGRFSAGPAKTLQGSCRETGRCRSDARFWVCASLKLKLTHFSHFYETAWREASQSYCLRGHAPGRTVWAILKNPNSPQGPYQTDNSASTLESPRHK